MNKKQIEKKAFAYGKEAYFSGIKRVPCYDDNIIKLAKSFDAYYRIKLFKKWMDGYGLMVKFNFN